MQQMNASRVREFFADDEGYATVVLAAMAASVIGLAATITVLAGLVIGQHRAQLAADMSAVAAAYALADGQEFCRIAGQVSADNGAELADCVRDQQDVIITAVVRGQSARARAGPL